MKQRHSENGNIMIYLLMAVGLLAALVYAVANSGRANLGVMRGEQVRLAANDIISYADLIEKTVTQLRLRGTLETQLRFSHGDLAAVDYGTYGTDPENEIFNPEGGAAIYSTPAAEATTTGTENWKFISSNEIQDLNSTCGDDPCTELLMVLSNVKKDICIMINNLIKVSNSGNDPPGDSSFSEDQKFQGSFNYHETIGDDTAGNSIRGKSEACFEDTGANQYIYYKVLLAR